MGLEGVSSVTSQQGQGMCEKLGQYLGGKKSMSWGWKRGMGWHGGDRARLDFIPREWALQGKLQPVSSPGKGLMSTKPKFPSSLGGWKFPDSPVSRANPFTGLRSAPLHGRKPVPGFLNGARLRVADTLKEGCGAAPTCNAWWEAASGSKNLLWKYSQSRCLMPKAEI